MTEQKYPADIIEKVAKAMAIRDYDGCFERLDGTDPDSKESLPTDEEDAEWWRKRAVAALDALGLTVTEEWRGYEGAPVSGSRSWAQHVVSPGTPVQRRALLVAETPWVEVPDAE